MFYFRINKIKILSNREKGFLFLNKDRAEVKLYSFVTTENTDLTELANLDYGSDEEDRRMIIKATVERCVSTRTFVEIRHVKDNQTLSFGDTGYVLYQSDRIPDDFNWIFLAVESDRGSRDFGNFMDEAVNDDNFRTFSKSIFPRLNLPGGNLANTAGYILITYLTGVLTDRIKKNKDDVIGTLYMSLNRVEHYPQCFRKIDNVPDLTQNMFVDYIIFANEEATALPEIGKDLAAVQSGKM